MEEFEKAYKSGDLMGMRTWADILFKFNDGKSCIRAYVNQHPFFEKFMEKMPSTNEFIANG